MQHRRRRVLATVTVAVALLLAPQTVRAQDLTNWSPRSEMADRASRNRPALARKGDSLCMAWRGVLENSIWVSITREAWTSQRMLGDRGTQGGPALASLGDNYVMVWRGVNENNFWVATSADGLNWSPQRGLTDRGSRDDPAVAGAGGLAVMAWRGVFENSIWVATSADGLNWSPQQELRGLDTQGSPALAASAAPARKYVLAWRGADRNTLRVATSADGLNWSPQQELTGATATSSPALAYSESLKRWYMAWRSDDRGAISVASSADGLSWSPPRAVNGLASQDAPSLASIGDTLTMIARGTDRATIWTSILAPDAGELFARENLKERAGAWTRPLIPQGQENNWMQAIHAAVLPDGKVLIANGSSNRNRWENGQLLEGVDTQNDAVVNNTCVFDPESQTFERIGSPPAVRTVDGRPEPNDVFCGHQVQLWNGNVLFASGTSAYYPNGGFRGSRPANIYDWKNKAWLDAGAMENGHWYPTLLPLQDGRVAVFSGFKQDESRTSPLVEFYNPFKSKNEAWTWVDINREPGSPYFTRVGGNNGAFDEMPLYPRILPLADGRYVFIGHGAGASPLWSRKSYFLTIPPQKDGDDPTVTFADGPDRRDDRRTYAVAINDPNAPSEVLTVGGQRGSDDINHGPGAQTVGGAEVTSLLERLRKDTQGWTWDLVPNFLGDNPQLDGRIMHNAVVLPTKQVLVVGGGNYAYYRPTLRPVLMTSDPRAAGGYRTQVMNPSVIPRLYHTSAVLLQDGRVFLAGGNSHRATRDVRDGSVNRFVNAPGIPPEPSIPSEAWEAEVFSPPYLFLPGSRPEITQAPKSIGFGARAAVTVANATANSSLVLVRLPSTTHGMDLGQQLIDLPIDPTPSSTGQVTFTAPSKSPIATPGYYMLFYVNGSGKPSKAAFVQLGADDTGLLADASAKKN